MPYITQGTLVKVNNVTGIVIGFDKSSKTMVIRKDTGGVSVSHASNVQVISYKGV